MGISPDHTAIRQARKRGLFSDPQPIDRLPRVELPIPPSTNNLYTTTKKRRRVKSQQYQRWLARAMPLARRLAKPAALPCRFRCLIQGSPDSRRDGDNMQKPLLDLCVTAGIIPDDRLSVVCGGAWDYIVSEGEPRVVIWFEG